MNNIVQLSSKPQTSEHRSSTICAVVERPDRHCGDDLVIKDRRGPNRKGTAVVEFIVLVDGQGFHSLDVFIVRSSSNAVRAVLRADDRERYIKDSRAEPY